MLAYLDALMRATRIPKNRSLVDLVLNLLCMASSSLLTPLKSMLQEQ